MLLSESVLPNDFSANTSYSAAYLADILMQSAVTYTPSNKVWKALPNDITSGNEQLVLVGQGLNFASLQKIVQQYFSQTEQCVFRLHPLHGKFAQQAVVMTLVHQEHENLVTTELLHSISAAFFIDCFSISSVNIHEAGVLVMDMDSTIINMECIDEIADLVGVGEKVSALTERAMQGELDFNQSLNARVACLTGISVDQLEALKSRLPINPGFAETIAILQHHGWTTVIASGGFTYFANYLKDTFTLTDAFSNTLGIKDNLLTGKVEGDIVNGEMKRDILLNTCEKYGISTAQSVAIGDGANDLVMMSAAQLGVAYKAKPKVKLAADASIQYCGFEGLLYCLVH
ncbi:MAG: phosphoserine phosphatase SerB [Glaciecola sp.]